MSAGSIHHRRFRDHLESNYGWLKKSILQENPNLGEKDILTRILLGFSLDMIAGCPKDEIPDHITDGAKDDGIDAFYFNRTRQEAYIFQSKFTDKVNVSPISEQDARSFTYGISELFDSNLNFGNEKLRALKSEIDDALTMGDVEFKPILVTTSEKDIPENVRRIFKKNFEVSFGNENALVHKRLSDLYETISLYGGGPGINFELLLYGFNVISIPFNGYYGWLTGDALASLYRKFGTKLFSKNLRSGLGRTEINDEVYLTALNNPQNFWYYNNGITFVADQVKRTWKGGYSAENVELKVTSGSIVNGAQTTSSLGQLLNEEKGQDALRQIKCLVRVLEIPESNSQFLSNVTRYTNSQNGIGAKDFVSLDPFQQKLRRDLDREFAISYIIRSGEESRDESLSTTITLQEATVALVVCGNSVESVVRAKSSISSLWRDTTQSPYKDIFNEQKVTALAIRKAVEANRKVESFLKNINNEKMQSIIAHGNRLFSFYVLNGINIWRENQSFDNFKQSLSKFALDKYFESFVHEIEHNYGKSYKAPLFKNQTKCAAIIAALPEL